MRALFFVVWLCASCKTSHTLDASLVATDDKEKTTAVGPSAAFKFAPIAGKPANADKPDGLPPHGDLLSAILHAGSLETLRELSRKQEKINSADKSAPGGIFNLWFLVGLLPLVAGVLVWKLQPAWLGAALAALKAVWNTAKSLFGRKAS